MVIHVMYKREYYRCRQTLGRGSKAVRMVILSRLKVCMLKSASGENTITLLAAQGRHPAAPPRVLINDAITHRSGFWQ